MKINKFWIALTWFLAVAWINEAQAQTKSNTNQELCENFSPKKNNTITIRNKKDLPKEITDHEEFINTNNRPVFSDRINKALLFYINLRNEIAEPNGSLYSLKKEFDSIPKDDLQYIRKRGAVPVLKKYLK